MYHYSVCRIPLVQRHVSSPDGSTRPKQDKAVKAAAKQKEEEQPHAQEADERLLVDVHGQATAAVDKIVCVMILICASIVSCLPCCVIQLYIYLFTDGMTELNCAIY